jgi:hypothetical protein
MKKIISVHEYVLRRGVASTGFEGAIRDASRRGVLTLAGLEHAYLLKGLRGRRRGEYAAVWIYESPEAWEELWGPVEKPCGRDGYPRKWRIWEDEVLNPYLAEEPDKIAYTAYEELR